MLSSDKDGEVLATVRAIARTLNGAGLDWHDLAVMLSAPAVGFAKAEKPPIPREEFPDERVALFAGLLLFRLR
jgi:hypothetical protein